jgi:hypothetical protein
MTGVFAEDRPKAPFVVDQHPAGAPGPRGSHPPLGIAIRARGPRRSLYYLHALGGEDLAGRGGELGVAVPDDEAEGAGPLAEVHDQVAGLLRGPGAVRAGGHAEDVHVPGRDLHEEQDVQAFEEDRVHSEEVAGQQSSRLSA